MFSIRIYFADYHIMILMHRHDDECVLKHSAFFLNFMTS